MSGFEIAGIVLGALPILFKAVDFSKDGFSRVGLAFQRRKTVEKLARALLLQQQILEETLKSVFIASGCEDILQFEKDPIEFLKNKTVHDEALEYLGQKNGMVLVETLNQSKQIVTKIANNISGLVPSYQGKPGDLLAIIEANTDAQGKQLEILPKIKLVFGIRDIKEASSELDETTAAFDRFTRLALSNRRAIDDQSHKKAVKLAKALRHARRYASNLFVAITNGWGSICSSEHHASLVLEDRVDVASRLLRDAGKCYNDPIITFELIFQAHVTHNMKAWHETSVQIFDEDEDLQRAPSTASHVTFATTSRPSARPDIAIITTICQSLEKSRASNKQLAFAIIGQKPMGFIPLHGSCKCNHAKESVSLHALLAKKVPSSRPMILPPKHRMLLALRLASNLLQLLQTHWLPDTWTKDSIQFPVGSQVSQIDLSRPFISCNFAHNCSTPSQTSSIDPKVALLELGILLLEIWHECTLEQWFPAQPATSGFYQRLALATEWRDDTHNPLPDLYDKAVSQCIYRPPGENRITDWEDDKFWKSVCGQIIEPLSKNCMQWR